MLKIDYRDELLASYPCIHPSRPGPTDVAGDATGNGRAPRRGLEELGDAIGAGKYAAGIGEVWQLAHDGRGDTLLVEEDFRYAGRLHSSGLLMPAEENAADADFMGDAVDDLLEWVLDKDGRAVFVENGSLNTHNRIAMILRW